MRNKILFALALFCVIAIPSPAQDPQETRGPGPPSGQSPVPDCIQFKKYRDTLTGDFWTSSGLPCTWVKPGGGSGTVNSATANQLAVYPATAAAVNGLANMFAKTTTDSFYLTDTLPTVSGGVIQNVVVGTGGSGSHLAQGANLIGGQQNVIMGYQACPNATSMRSSVCIGWQAGAGITGNGTGPDDMIGVYIGALAAAHLTNLGGATIAIGEDAINVATSAASTTAVGTHVGANIGTDVNGSFYGGAVLDGCTGCNTTNVTFIGARAGTTAVVNSNLSDDTCVGQWCFANIDGTGSTTGSQNTGIGSQVGLRLGQGNLNFIAGYLAGSYPNGTKLTGTRNILIGDQIVAKGLTTGSDNFVMDEAGGGLTTGSYNFMWGNAQTGQGVTTGSDNITLGEFSGQTMTNVSRSVMIGFVAGFANNASDQVFVGTRTGQFYTGLTGTFVGNHAGTNSAASAGASSGTGVSAFGDTSCFSLTTGSSDECFGASADIAAGLSHAAEIGPGQNTVANTLAFEGKSFVDNSGNLTGVTYKTATNCSSSAAPAVCAAAPAGSVVVAAAGTTVVVNTTAVTANSQIFVQEDSSLGTKLSVTCNTNPATAPPTVSARVAATSFTITTTTPTTNPRCFSYSIIN